MNIEVEENIEDVVNTAAEEEKVVVTENGSQEVNTEEEVKVEVVVEEEVEVIDLLLPHLLEKKVLSILTFKRDSRKNLTSEQKMIGKFSLRYLFLFFFITIYLSLFPFLSIFFFNY